MAETESLLSTCCTVQLFTDKEETKVSSKYGKFRDKNRMGHKKTTHVTDPYKNWVRSGVSSSCFLYNICHVVHHQRHVYRIQWFPFKLF